MYISNQTLIIIFFFIVITIFVIKYKKQLYVRSMFLAYDIKSLWGYAWRFDSEHCSVMKNDFYTNIPLNYYSQFNTHIYDRIISGNNKLHIPKIKNVCNEMLNYIKNNNIPKNKPKLLRIIDLKLQSKAHDKIQYYIRKDIPFVIRNLDLDIFKLNFNQLIQLVKGEKVLFSPNPPYCSKSYVGNFEEIQNNKCYLSNITNLFLKYKNILTKQDIEKISKLSGGIMDSKQLFIGKKKGTGTRLHNAFTNNFFINIEGNKTWTLFNPNNTPLLYPHFSKSGVYNASQSRFINYKVSNLDDFPLMKYVDYYEYTMKPGEVLYNPASWWHAVYNETDTTFALSTRWVFPNIFLHNRDNYMLRCGNLNNKNLRNLAEKLYVKYNIFGIDVIDEHNILGNNNKEIPIWDQITNESHLLCLKNKCGLNWH